MKRTNKILVVGLGILALGGLYHLRTNAKYQQGKDEGQQTRIMAIQRSLDDYINTRMKQHYDTNYSDLREDMSIPAYDAEKWARISFINPEIENAIPSLATAGRDYRNRLRSDVISRLQHLQLGDLMPDYWKTPKRNNK